MARGLLRRRRIGDHRLTKLPELLVIRHAETDWNSRSMLQGHRDSPLTLNGVRQVLAVGETLAPEIATAQPKHFWCSPLGRAQQTAAILAGLWSLPFYKFDTVSALRERSYGVWEGMRQDEIAERRPEEHDAHMADPWHSRMEGAETKVEIYDRLSNWVRSLNHDVLHVVVTHSGCLRILRGIYSGASRQQIDEFREPQTASFLLSDTERMIEPTEAVLSRHGCEGLGRTVWI